MAYDGELNRENTTGAPGKLKIVGFAGGGGSSVALKLATGCDPDLAMNHWLTAVLAHQRHFPKTDHFCADIFETDPRAWRPGEKVAFAWFSPDCTDFSKAKGKAPRSERIRGLIWSTVAWALWRRPDVMMIENVEEFEQGGPVYRCANDWRAKGVPGVPGEPIVALRGRMFQRWVTIMRRMGGTVDWRVLNAADYGAPTTRKRLYVIVRFDGKPIVWPERTHAPRKEAGKLGLKQWRGACEIIDWSLDCPSIFLTPEEVEALRKATGKRVNRPLVPATLSRIARGMERYVIGSADPFIVPVTHQGSVRAHDVREPLKTVTSANRGEFAVCDPTVAMLSNAYGSNTRGGRGDPEEPAKTITSAGHTSVVTGSVVKFQENSTFTDPREPLHTVMAGAPRHGVVTANLIPRYGERPGQAPRAADVEEPLPVVVPTGNGASLVAGSIVRTGFQSAAGRNGVRDPQEPLATVTSDGGIGLAAAHLHQMNTRDVGADAADPLRTAAGKDHQGVVSAYLGRQFGSTVSGRDIEEPHPTVMTEGGGKSQLVTAALDTYYTTGSNGADVAEPLRTATGKARHSVYMAWLEQANTGMTGHDARDPASTIVGRGTTQRLVEARLELDGGAVGRRGKVLEFLWAHFGLPTEAEWLAPAETLQARLKFGLVLIGETVWMIVDIGLRMLVPRELAGAMGLPPEFHLETDVNGRKVSKTDQTQMIGNMVSPPPAAALIRANCPDLIEPEWKDAA